MKRVAIVFGGASAEHDVSIMSAASIEANIDKDLFSTVLIGLNRENQAFLFEAIDALESDVLFSKGKALDAVALTAQLKQAVDVVFPIIHGPGGEDGQLQGFLKFLGIPFVGSDVTASAVCMDKRLAKEILKANHFLQAPYKTLTRKQYKTLLAASDLESIISGELVYPVFVKPANLGSSLGIHKVHKADELVNALEDAFRYDYTVILEKGIDARELECGVLGTDDLDHEPIAMAVGEIVASHEFYDYEAKYSDQAPSELIIPAQISDITIEKIRNESLRAYKLLGCSGMARVDFLVDKKTEAVYISELNTLPGFTKFSMYPSLCAQRGVSYKALITDLLEQAFRSCL